MATERPKFVAVIPSSSGELTALTECGEVWIHTDYGWHRKVPQLEWRDVLHQGTGNWDISPPRPPGYNLASWKKSTDGTGTYRIRSPGEPTHD